MSIHIGSAREKALFIFTYAFYHGFDSLDSCRNARKTTLSTLLCKAIIIWKAEFSVNNLVE